jgi:hypothetical protein
LYLTSCFAWSWALKMFGISFPVISPNIYRITKRYISGQILVLAIAAKYFDYAPGIQVTAVIISVMLLSIFGNTVNLKLLKIISIYFIKRICITFRILLYMVTVLCIGVFLEWSTDTIRLVEVEAEVNLRPTVSRPVSLGVRRPSGTRDQFYFRVENFFKELRFIILYCPLWREDGSVIYCSIASGPCQSNHS